MSDASLECPRCPTCGKSFPSYHGLTGHLGRLPDHRTPGFDLTMAEHSVKARRAADKRRREAHPEKRREVNRRWREEHPDYNREWRREHALQERERIRIWREHNRDLVRAQRLRYYLKHPRPERDEMPFPPKFQGHEFFETARFICGTEPYWEASQFGWEEAMAEAVLALVEGRDPNQAAADSWAYQRRWHYATGPLYDNVDVREDTREVVFIARHDDWR